jgi:hypothetical protein
MDPTMIHTVRRREAEVDARGAAGWGEKEAMEGKRVRRNSREKRRK